MGKPQSCLICESGGASYKFRCCKRGFCSSSCFSKHTECDSPKDEKPFFPERKFIRHSSYDLNLSEDEIISDEVFEKITANSDISSFLSDPLIQRILVRLDMSKNRRDVFAKLSETSPAFVQLLEMIGSAIGLEATSD